MAEKAKKNNNGKTREKKQLTMQNAYTNSYTRVVYCAYHSVYNTLDFIAVADVAATAAISCLAVFGFISLSRLRSLSLPLCVGCV